MIYDEWERVREEETNSNFGIIAFLTCVNIAESPVTDLPDKFFFFTASRCPRFRSHLCKPP